MVIDEDRKFILTNYEQVQRGGKAADTDHLTEYLDLDLKIETEKPDRREIWVSKIKKLKKFLKLKQQILLNFLNAFKANSLFWCK